MRTIKLTIAATETHCETDDDQCVYMRGVICSVFNRGLWDSVVTTDGLYCGESKRHLCAMCTPGGKCSLFGFAQLSLDDEGWLRADACIKAEEAGS